MTTAHDALEYNRMIETARKRAHLLREEAADAFWHEAGDAARLAWRSAARLAARLARHSRERAAMEG